MMKKIVCVLFLMVILNPLWAADDIKGFWKTVDEKSGKVQSVIAIYPYQGKYYGRIIGAYDDKGAISDTIYAPVDKAPGVIGHPYYSGLDIIWDLEPKGKKFVDGEILDPEKGRIYGAELWTEKGKLIVRGKLLFMGRNQTWLPMADNEFNTTFKKPDLQKFVPVIPKVK